MERKILFSNVFVRHTQVWIYPWCAMIQNRLEIFILWRWCVWGRLAVTQGEQVGTHLVCTNNCLQPAQTQRQTDTHTHTHTSKCVAFYQAYTYIRWDEEKGKLVEKSCQTDREGTWSHTQFVMHAWIQRKLFSPARRVLWTLVIILLHSK